MQPREFRVRKPIVAGNWKMNGDVASIDLLVQDILAGLVTAAKCEVILFPAFVHLKQVLDAIDGSGIAVGSQDADFRAPGAVTGGVSAAMIRDLGCSHAIVGHSERRALFSESDEAVALKFEACLGCGLTPILCVGETLDERRAADTLAVVTRQLDAVIDRVGVQGISQGIVAYEPVWAIGTGESATPAQAEEVHAALRERLAASSTEMSQEMRILYGGSVNAENASSLFANENVDGGLVGGAAMKGNSFIDICNAADELVN